jgi:hypothetical protein
MNRYAISFALVSMLFAGTAAAESATVDLSNRTFHLGLGEILDTGPSSGAPPHVGYEAGALFHSEDNADFNQGYLGLKGIGDFTVMGLRMRGALGARALYFSGDRGDGEVLGLAGSLAARVPYIQRLAVAIDGVYAPDPISFGDAHQYSQVDLDIGYYVFPTVCIFGGYRNIGVDYGSGHHSVDNGWLGGVSVRFGKT